MDTQPEEEYEEPLNAETPEDVAVLYAWANLHGAKYRDFSASRREYRAQVRHRAAEDLRRAELLAQAEAERSAAEADRAVLEAERMARSSESYNAEGMREQALRAADEASRMAAAERLEAARRAEAAAAAEMAARREEREIAEAHASAQRQAARYADSEVRRRSLAGPQPASVLIPGLASDPYVTSQGSGPEVNLYSPDTQLEVVQPSRFRGDATGGAGLDTIERGLNRTAEGEVRRRPQGYRPEESSGLLPVLDGGRAGLPGDRIATADSASAVPDFPGASPALPTYGTDALAPAQPFAVPAEPYTVERDAFAGETGDDRPDRDYESAAGSASPAWLFESKSMRPVAPADASSGLSAVDTMQHSRERVASRWYALKGALEPGQEAAEQKPETGSQPDPQPDPKVCMVGIFSLAGGVGKTSLVATLGRAFSAMGEAVLLADTTSHGLLPFYFGASELRPGVIRTFSPPEGSPDAAIHLVSYDVESASRPEARTALTKAFLDASAGKDHTLLDLNSASSWLLESLARRPLVLLVPVAADMNAVISLGSVERFFDGLTDAEGNQVRPFFVINGFDSALPLHLDVREVLRRQLGDRLLPYTIRRAPAVGEALAEGMTVVDYAPGSPVAEDYVQVAEWVKSVSTPDIQGVRSTRWSER